MRPAIAVMLALPLLAGCQPEGDVSPLLLRATPQGGECTSEQEPRALAALQGELLRLSVVRRGTTGAEPTLVCDRAVRLGQDSGGADLALTSRLVQESGQLELWLELFRDGPPRQLVASGVLSQLDLQPPRQRPLEQLLLPPGRFACTPGPQGVGRAFHSATPLPNGQVLLVGGLTQLMPSAGPAQELRVSPTVELYEPRSGRFIAAAGQLPAGRAFHSALLLQGPEQGPYDLLLLGGLTVPDETPNAPALRRGRPDDPLPLMPTKFAVPASSQVIRVYPWADPPQVQQLAASPALAARMFHAQATTRNGETVVLGGLASISGGRLSTVDQLELLPEAGQSVHRGPYPLARARLGAAAAAVADDLVLVYGGNIDSSPAQAKGQVAELIQLAADPDSSTVGLEFGSAPAVHPVAFASLTALPDGEALLFGGLRLDQGQAMEPLPQGTPRRLSLVSGELRLTDVVAAQVVPVGYPQGIALDGGHVLLAGGLAVEGECSSGLACDRAYHYDPDVAQLDALAPMLLPRIGQRLSALPGGAVLVSGGLQLTQSGFTAQRGAELFRLTGGEDPFGRAAGELGGESCPSQ